MHIGIDIRHLTAPEVTGVGRYTIDLLEALFVIDKENTYTLCSSGRSAEHVPMFAQNNVHHIHLNRPNRVVSLLLQTKQRTFEELFSVEPDMWFLPNANFFHSSLPYLLTLHDLSFVHMPEVFTLKQRLWHQLIDVKHLAQNAQHLLAVSEATKVDVHQTWQIPAEDISVTPLGIDRSVSSREQPNDRSRLRQHNIRKPYILMVSSREPRKNMLRAIQAFERFYETHPNYQLVIVGGEGWKRHPVNRYLANNPIAQHVIQTGYVPAQHLPALYRHTSCFLFPSLHEGFGLPPLEALSYGTPVVASAIASLREVLAPHAIFVNPFHVHEITEALEHQVHTHKKEAQNARILHTEPYSYDRTARKTRAVFTHVFNQ